MRNCFVPHCDAFCKKNGILKRMMFSAPKDNFEQWKKKLFNKREFRETDRVCERHFDKGQILTHWEHIIDGKLCQLEREKPKIRPDAIPYLNLPEADDLIGISNRKRTPKEPKKRKQNLSNSNHKDKVIKPNDDNEYFTLSDLDLNGPEVKLPLKSPKSPKKTQKNIKVERLSAEEKHQVFETVYDDIYEVTLPNTLWGIHRDPEDRQYIAFTKFDASEMKSTIAVKITNNFDLKVHVNGAQQTSDTLKSLSVDELTKLLNQLNEAAESKTK